MLEITRHDIQEADTRVGDSAQGLLGTIRETYTQKKHGIFSYLYVISIVFHSCVFLLDLLESASSAKESVEQTVSESLHSNFYPKQILKGGSIK